MREDAAIQNDSSTSKVIDQLHQLGCRISIDDLGSGYSALSYIRDLPVDVLKIDRDLINQVTCDPVSAAVVDAICQMCKAVGIHIVAEDRGEDILPVLLGSASATARATSSGTRRRQQRSPDEQQQQPADLTPWSGAGAAALLTPAPDSGLPPDGATKVPPKPGGTLWKPLPA